MARLVSSGDIAGVIISGIVPGQVVVIGKANPCLFANDAHDRALSYLPAKTGRWEQVFNRAGSFLVIL